MEKLSGTSGTHTWRYSLRTPAKGTFASCAHLAIMLTQLVVSQRRFRCARIEAILLSADGVDARRFDRKAAALQSCVPPLGLGAKDDG